MNERRGWRRDLAIELGLAKNNLPRLLDNAAAPNYHHYLGLLGFLEQRGVHVMFQAPAAAARRSSVSAEQNQLE